MSFLQKLVAEVPSPLLALLMIGILMAFSVAGTWTVRRLIPYDRLKRHHEVASPIFGMVGTLYAVFLAFIVIAVWEHFETANCNVRQEAIYLADVYRNAEAFSPDFTQQVARLTRQYREEVIKKEWKNMTHGQASPEVERQIRDIWAIYTKYSPRNDTEQAFFEESLDKLNDLRELRRRRLMEANTGIHFMLWLILGIGAFATISFTFLFGAESLPVHLLMEILLSIVVGLILFTILSMDYPFSGGISISPAPFQQLLLD
ncbi:MAG: DUF4239 domain-containing protein [Candidatus Omnitrophota bacterium]